MLTHASLDGSSWARERYPSGIHAPLKEAAMSEPRDFNDTSSPADSSEQIEQISELDPRVDADDQVKGGRNKRAEDPDQGGEVYRP
jgi:hypothetical protein